VAAGVISPRCTSQSAAGPVPASTSWSDCATEGGQERKLAGCAAAAGTRWGRGGKGSGAALAAWGGAQRLWALYLRMWVRVPKPVRRWTILRTLLLKWPLYVWVTLGLEWLCTPSLRPVCQGLKSLWGGLKSLLWWAKPLLWWAKSFL
jgi:hypothetical protein